MWSGLRVARADPAFVSASEELLQSTTRLLIVFVTVIYSAWYFGAAEFMPAQLSVSFLPVAFLLAAACTASLCLLPRSLLGAQATWQVGFAAAVTLTTYVTRQSAIAFLYALLPLMAAIAVGWQAGLLAEVAIVALVYWYTHSPIMPAMSPAAGLAVTGAGAITGVLGWAVTRSLLTVTQWSFFSFNQAMRKVEEARDQRLELKQTQQDLILANRELARLSDRLEAMYQIAEEARRAKEEFVANVSHELRTPLNMIIGFSEMITLLPQVYGARLPRVLLADIAAIQRNSQHLAKLVDDVLDLSQVEAGRMALSKEWTAVQAIVDEAVLATGALFKSKGLYLEAEIATDLPQAFCDGTRIRQVVLNLLSNAGRFTQRGGVRVRAWFEKGSIVISVADTGPGISSNDQQRLFEPFQQLDDTKGRRGGSGLGLCVSRQFVEMHGGKMWLESQVGVGTTFYFSLPLQTASPAGSDDVFRWFGPYQEYEPRARRSKAPAPQLIPRFVLLEQGDALQRLFGRYLDDVEVIAARNGEEALAELERSPARALIVNTSSLSEMQGPAAQLPHLPYDTPAISCWVPGPDEAAERLGVVRYLTKPVHRDALLSTLEQLGEGVKSVLLVDDEPEALQLFARMLSTADRRYRVLQAANGPRALNLLRERRPDVMLLDLVMPGMDGLQVLQEKAMDPSIRDIPVVVISSRDPSSEAIVGGTLTVSCNGGMSVRDLLGCIQAVSNVLSPSSRAEHQERPRGPAG